MITNKQSHSKKIKRQPLTKRKIFWGSLAAIALLFLCFIVWGYASATIYTYRQVVNLAGSEQVRELIIAATDLPDAPLDPKNGDIYFPSAKLYLPAQESHPRLAYTPSDTTNPAEINISNVAIVKSQASALTASGSNDEVFKHVAKLQACQRGVALSETQKAPEILLDGVLKNTIKLSNGKTLYAYIEKACPENYETAQLLSELRAY